MPSRKRKADSIGVKPATSAPSTVDLPPTSEVNGPRPTLDGIPLLDAEQICSYLGEEDLLRLRYVSRHFTQLITTYFEQHNKRLTIHCVKFDDIKFDRSSHNVHIYIIAANAAFHDFTDLGRRIANPELLDRVEMVEGKPCFHLKIPVRNSKDPVISYLREDVFSHSVNVLRLDSRYFDFNSWDKALIVTKCRKLSMALYLPTDFDGAINIVKSRSVSSVHFDVGYLLCSGRDAMKLFSVLVILNLSVKLNTRRYMEEHNPILSYYDLWSDFIAQRLHEGYTVKVNDTDVMLGVHTHSRVSSIEWTK